MNVGDRPSGWSFPQADTSELRAFVGNNAVTLRDTYGEGGYESFSMRVQGSTQEKEAGLRLMEGDNRVTLQAKADGSLVEGTLGLEAEPQLTSDGRTPMAGPGTAGKVKLQPIAADANGVREYSLSFGDRQYSLKNDHGKLEVREDQGVRGTSDAGDFSITADEQGNTHLQVIDKHGHEVEVVDKSGEDMVQDNALQINQLVKEGKFDEAAAQYKELTDSGIGFEDLTTGWSASRADDEAKFKQELDNKLIQEATGTVQKWEEPSAKPQLEPAAMSQLLQVMGLKKETAAQLTQPDGTTTKVDQLHAFYETGNITNEGSFTDWLKHADQLGKVNDLVSKLKSIKDDSSGFFTDEQKVAENIFLMDHLEHGEEALKVAHAVQEEMDDWFVNKDFVVQKISGLSDGAKAIFEDTYIAATDDNQNLSGDLMDNDFSDSQLRKIESMVS